MNKSLLIVCACLFLSVPTLSAAQKDAATSKKITYDWKTEEANWEKWWSNNGCIISRGHMVGLRVYHYDKDGKMTHETTYVRISSIVALKDTPPDKTAQNVLRVHTTDGKIHWAGVFRMSGVTDADIKKHRVPGALWAANFLFNKNNNKEIE